MQETKEQSYEKIMEYENRVHEKNQQRIKIGIRLVIIIPLIFLAVMFKLDSSKVVFLVLWIVSLFAISLYLIVVEYMDYQMQEKLKEFGFKDEDSDIKGLLNDNLVVEKVIESTGLLEDKQAQEPVSEPQLQIEAPVSEPQIQVEATVSEPEVQVEATVSKPEAQPQQVIPEPIVENTVGSDELSQAEEELVESIRKYVTTLGRQAAAAPAIDEAQRKDAQDYAAMRKARAAARRPKTQDEWKD